MTDAEDFLQTPAGREALIVALDETIACLVDKRDEDAATIAKLKRKLKRRTRQRDEARDEVDLWISRFEANNLFAEGIRAEALEEAAQAVEAWDGRHRALLANAIRALIPASDAVGHATAPSRPEPMPGAVEPGSGSSDPENVEMAVPGQDSTQPERGVSGPWTTVRASWREF